MPTLLARNANILVTMDDQRRELPDAGLFARDGIIEEVGTSEQLPQDADVVLDLSGPPPPRPDVDPRAASRPEHQFVPLAAGPLSDLGPPDAGGLALERPRRSCRTGNLRMHDRFRPHLHLPERLPGRRPDFGGTGDRGSIPRFSGLDVPWRVPGRVATG